MMDMNKRAAAYAHDNGQAHTLTPRQRRRIQHKLNHALAPFGPKAMGHLAEIVRAR